MRDARDVFCDGEDEEDKDEDMDGQQHNEENKRELKDKTTSKAKKASLTTILPRDGTKVVQTRKRRSLPDGSLLVKTTKETIAPAANQAASTDPNVAKEDHGSRIIETITKR